MEMLNINKEQYFTILIDKYIIVIERLIDYLYVNDMLPTRIICLKEYIKEYIDNLKKDNNDTIN